MYGIGTLASSFYYDLWVRMPAGEPRKFIRDLAPEFHEYRRLKLMIIISHEYKYLYVINPKVASTSIRNRLRELNGYPPLDNPRDVMGHKGSGFVLPKHLSEKEFFDICSGRKGYYTFSFVRNPFDRLVSAYTYFQRGVDQPGFNAEKKSIYLRKWDPHRDPKTRTKMGFEEFVEGVCRNTHHMQDQHWRTQCDLLKINKINYDFVGKMEKFASNFVSVLKHLDAPDEIIARAGDVTNSSERRKNDIASFFTDKAADMVREKFKEDFERFDYSMDLPSLQRVST
ncbi:sulfotransferase family 2 domain-containing protein [Rhizobiales bacterium]|uniref:sulfotransferase family protein n=1 Tax=Hongsoonwoonella zoysiae TaxID=2821844 RepID=UPI001560F951|nr:sulfotransferase family protein [Hongsoonwoonella zoysiae]NRG18490.1 sulfotransferase family 2 domain-containing protein [Hongsoonwoonella zoysiae]